MINTYKKAFEKNEEISEELYKNMVAKDLILRDYLAIERTVLTNEATFLAYIRTSLTLLAVGVTLFHLSTSNTLQYIGVAVGLFGFYIFLLGSVRSARMKNKINDFVKRKNEAQEKSEVSRQQKN